ncbi:hypothetical protein ABZZ17_04615 [Streptomyces sp. NPDC006512]|uniref:hypothetical protein n=1 Tax=Streptomyces sp. NPDC006512 TaxID=3154307 RepID=UPI0033AA7221
MPRFGLPVVTVGHVERLPGSGEALLVDDGAYGALREDVVTELCARRGAPRPFFGGARV